MAGQDDRGVSTLVGAILLFGMILVVYATWQAAVVPAENKQVEFDAFQEAGTDVADLHSAMQRAGAMGVQTSTVVHTGARYPPRVTFVNPPPASGTLSTRPAGDVTFSNVAATDGDVRDYWNSSERTLAFDTHQIVFRTGYNELRVNDLGIDPSGAVYLAAERSVMRDSQTLVSGNRITLVTVAGGYRAGGVTVSPSVEPVSVGSETISVRNASGGPLTMTLPTRLDQDTWDDIADGQTRITDAAVNSGDVTIQFRDGTYKLRLARVALREPTGAAPDADLSPRYVAAEDRAPGPTLAGVPVSLSADVRDKYNNGLADADVVFDTSATQTDLGVPNGEDCSAVDDWATDGDVTVTSDADGRAVACVRSDQKKQRTLSVTARVAGSSDEANRTAFNVTVFKK